MINTQDTFNKVLEAAKKVVLEIEINFTANKTYYGIVLKTDKKVFRNTQVRESIYSEFDDGFLVESVEAVLVKMEAALKAGRTPNINNWVDATDYFSADYHAA